MKRQNFYNGAVSLFMVIFSMLVISIVTLGFLRLMVADQRQASNSDLSQSAYDSALAGVEDAKRALLAYQRACATGGAACGTVVRDLFAGDVEAQPCNRVLTATGVVALGGENEVPVQKTGSSSDAKLDQAYTCVKINPNTPDVVGKLADGESKLIPLKGREAFDTVTVSWFSQTDIPAGTTSLDIPSSVVGADGRNLLRKDNWPDNRPSVLRAQFMQTGAGFTLDSFDAETTSGQSNANTVFLYPTSVSVANFGIADIDNRRVQGAEYATPGSTSDAPRDASCRANISAGGYACTATIRLPAPIGGGNAAASYLRLTPFYKATSFSITLSNGSVPVLFDGVQPMIDSTGRANDLFRRVEARVDLGSADFPYPEAAVDVADNFCKDFTVTDTTHVRNPSCTP